MEQTPKGNRVFYTIYRPFTAEGFHQLDVVGAMVEIGFSKASARRFHGVKVWDTIYEDGQWWRKQRLAKKIELLDCSCGSKEDYLLIGKNKVIVIKPSPVSLGRRISWWIRPRAEMLKEMLCKGGEAK